MRSGTHTGTSSRRKTAEILVEALRDFKAALERHHQFGHLMHGEHRKPMRDGVIKMHG